MQPNCSFLLQQPHILQVPGRKSQPGHGTAECSSASLSNAKSQEGQRRRVSWGQVVLKREPLTSCERGFFSPLPAALWELLTSSQRVHTDTSEPAAPRSFALSARKVLSGNTEDPMFLGLRPPSFWFPMLLSFCRSCGPAPLTVSSQGSQHMLCSCTTQREGETSRAWQAEIISAHIRRQSDACRALQ